MKKVSINDNNNDKNNSSIRNNRKPRQSVESMKPQPLNLEVSLTKDRIGLKAPPKDENDILHQLSHSHVKENDIDSDNETETADVRAGKGNRKNNNTKDKDKPGVSRGVGGGASAIVLHQDQIVKIQLNYIFINRCK